MIESTLRCQGIFQDFNGAKSNAFFGVQERLQQKREPCRKKSPGGSNGYRIGPDPSVGLFVLTADYFFGIDPLRSLPVFGFFLIVGGIGSPLRIKTIETELTQCRVFLAVSLSPRKTWPKWPPQLLQTISVLNLSASGTRVTAPGSSSSKAGQPQLLWNF